MKKLNFKILMPCIIVITLCYMLIAPLKCYAKTSTKVAIGKEISNTSLDDTYQYYTLTLKRKMKVKISVTVEAVEEQTTEETDENEDYDYDEFDENPNSIEFSLEGEDYETLIDYWNINAGETKIKTVVLDAGTYKIYICGYSEGLKYTFNTEDKSTYTKKLSMLSTLSLIAGNSKKITLKSAERGKSIGDVTWTTSNKKVATVDASGRVKGIKQGTCTINAKTKYSKTVKCNVTINTRPQLYIKEASFNINYFEGIEPYFTLQNNFGKTIKYIYLNTYFYNRVGDPAYCKIQNTNYQQLRITGPIKNGATESYCWEAVIYNSTTGKMYIKSAEIVFMDGTKKTISIKKSYK